MWNVKCLFLLFLCARPICAQNIWVVSPTDLYEQPKEEGIVSGILLRDALVEIISENQEWAKVKVDNNMIGYVKKKVSCRNIECQRSIYITTTSYHRSK
ncbi:SH3 domain-containing protein [Aquimarina aquimarini]|uniref:SH3 domain-containing protein n=1 Tax=Aquimarina aquimarini TaxID=1191734 RepID=UPI001F1B3331|nr:SH3 domain-containing protein [Aquimarina aquimarini]